MKYDQLSKEAQARAIMEVDNIHPIQTRDNTLDELVKEYYFRADGKLKDEPGAGLDPEYYEDILN